MHISLRLRQCVLCSGITTHCVCYHHKSMGNKFPYITWQYISFAPFLWQFFGRSTICMYVRLHPFIYPAYIYSHTTQPGDNSFNTKHTSQSQRARALNWYYPPYRLIVFLVFCHFCGAPLYAPSDGKIYVFLVLRYNSLFSLLHLYLSLAIPHFV